MRAEFRRVHSPDVQALASWIPADDFAILLQMMVGQEDGPGEESFDLTLCTPGWLAQQLRDGDPIDGRHHLVVVGYDARQLERYLRTRVSACEGDTWQEIAAKLGRLGRWERSRQTVVKRVRDLLM